MLRKLPHNRARTRSPYFWAALAAPVLVFILIRIHGVTMAAVLFVCFTLLLLLLAAIDCDRLILPDVCTMPGAVLALAAAPYVGLPLTESLAGALIGGGTFWLLAWKFPQSLGLGDAKLMLMLGALCGVRGVPIIILAGSALGLTTALVMGRKIIPFGPFLSFGAYLHMAGVRV